MTFLVSAFRRLTARNSSLRNFHSSPTARSEKTNNRKKIRYVQYSKEPVYPASAEPPIRLNDGSVFVSRIPRPSKPITEDMLPPLINVSKPKPPVEKISKETVKEMQRLRDSDPVKWSVANLAKKFNTSTYFLNLKLTTPLSRQVELEAQAEKDWQNSDYRRRLAIINRQRRKDLW